MKTKEIVVNDPKLGPEAEPMTIPVPLSRSGRIRWSALPDVNTRRLVILHEARPYVTDPVGFNSVTFKRVGRHDLANAVTAFYPGKFRALQEDLGVTSDRKPEGYYTAENMLRDARAFLIEEGNINRSLLRKKGKAGFAVKIDKEYPDGMRGIRADLDLNPGPKPKGYWTDETIKDRAIAFYKAEGTLNRDVMREKGETALATALNKYSGGLRQLKQDMGVEVSARQPKPKGYWTPENTEKEAIAYWQENGKLTQNALAEDDRVDLMQAIGKYKGGMYGLKTKIGYYAHYGSEQVPVDERGSIMWTQIAVDPERVKAVIEIEAQKAIDKGVKLTYKALMNDDFTALAGAVPRFYPGGMHALQKKMGVAVERKPRNYWQRPEAVGELKADVKAFAEQFGDVNTKLLKAQGRSDLIADIGQRWPGGWTKMREELSLDVVRNNNLRTAEQIEEEAIRYLQAGGIFSLNQIRKAEKWDLANAITRHYSGGISALKANLEAAGRIPEVKDISEEKKEELLDQFAALIRQNPSMNTSVLDFVTKAS